MTKAVKRSGLVILGLIAVITLAGLAAGCGCSDQGTLMTTSTSTNSSTDSTLVMSTKTRADYEAELPGLEKAVEAAPNDLDALLELAIAQYQLKEYEEAVATYKKMLLISNDALTRNNLGNVYRDWGKLDEAKAAYEMAIALDPTLTTTYINLAQVYKSEGDIDAAMEVLNRGSAAITGDDLTRLEKVKDKLTSTTTT